MLKKLIRDLVQKSPSLLAFEHLFRARIGAYKIDLQSIHNLFVDNSKKSKTSSLDLGSGPNPQNRFGADEVFGLDLIEDKEKKIFRCKLGFERIPFDDNSFDYITAYDLIEHIPRYSDSENSNTPLQHSVQHIVVYIFVKRCCNKHFNTFRQTSNLRLYMIIACHGDAQPNTY